MKKTLSERDICTKFITPALRRAGWDDLTQIREEVSFTKGRIIVRGKLVTRGKAKRADYILYHQPNIPIALIEAKDNNHAVGDGMQQGLAYAATLEIPFVFSSNGDAFLFHDRTGQGATMETELPLYAFPTPEALWSKYRAWRDLTPKQEEVFLQSYFEDGGGKAPRYYQCIAINRTLEAIAREQTAFSSLWRPEPARPMPPSRSSDACGRPAAKSASSFS
jgi:type I restriction enzyme R subunit